MLFPAKFNGKLKIKEKNLVLRENLERKVKIQIRKLWWGGGLA